MIYEYYLEDDTTEISEIPNIISFPRIYYSYLDKDNNDMIIEEKDIKVKYCIIKNNEKLD